jgi:nucleoside-diphosphate-sugar epimerase
MRVLVTGAAGFIGQSLVARLLDPKAFPAGDDAHELVLLDRVLDPSLARAGVELVQGDFRDAAILARALAAPVDCVFHLASTPGGTAESDPELGLSVNLGGTLSILEALRKRGHVARFVFASSIGVYGTPMPGQIDEQTPTEPSFSYGAQKLVGEILVHDYARRGVVQGISLRLPGIVARPRADGMISIFMSDLIRELSAGRRYTCPVGPEAVAWFMSRECVVDNLLHAASMPAAVCATRRAWLLPVLRATMAEVARAVSEARGTDVSGLVTYEPKPAVQAQFGSYPPLHCPTSEAAGFRHDGSLLRLVQRALIET